MSRQFIKKKILIVDSHPVYINKVEGFLRGLTFQNISLAKDGQDGIEKAKSEKPDLIILSSYLSDMLGCDVCRHLKDAGLSTKFIILSGLFTQDEDIQTMKRLGADEVLMRKEKDLLPLQHAVEKLIL